MTNVLEFEELLKFDTLRTIYEFRIYKDSNAFVSHDINFFSLFSF